MIGREFSLDLREHEPALARLAGGLAQRGEQCGMLWGATLAVGAEAWTRTEDLDRAIPIALQTIAALAASFRDRTGTVDCRDVTGRDLRTVRGLAGLLFDTLRKGMDNSTCFVLAQDWTPDAIRAARVGLEHEGRVLPRARSCASDVVAAMGGTRQEQAMVAGFGGGLGLGGDACGALAAAVWFKGVRWCREHPGKAPSPWAKTGDRTTLKVFEAQTSGTYRCAEICGRTFDSPASHAEFVRAGGCAELIAALAAGPE